MIDFVPSHGIVRSRDKNGNANRREEGDWNAGAKLEGLVNLNFDHLYFGDDEEEVKLSHPMLSDTDLDTFNSQHNTPLVTLTLNKLNSIALRGLKIMPLRIGSNLRNTAFQ